MLSNLTSLAERAKQVGGQVAAQAKRAAIESGFADVLGGGGGGGGGAGAPAGEGSAEQAALILKLKRAMRKEIAKRAALEVDRLEALRFLFAAGVLPGNEGGDPAGAFEVGKVDRRTLLEGWAKTLSARGWGAGAAAATTAAEEAAAAAAAAAAGEGAGEEGGGGGGGAPLAAYDLPPEARKPALVKDKVGRVDVCGAVAVAGHECRDIVH